MAVAAVGPAAAARGVQGAEAGADRVPHAGLSGSGEGRRQRTEGVVGGRGTFIVVDLDGQVAAYFQSLLLVFWGKCMKKKKQQQLAIHVFFKKKIGRVRGQLPTKVERFFFFFFLGGAQGGGGVCF